MIIDSASGEGGSSEGGSSENSGGDNVSPSAHSGQSGQVETNKEKDGDSLTDRLLGD
jgi:multimodular transpeptidase-transglycosylase PBP 1A